MQGIWWSTIIWLGIMIFGDHDPIEIIIENGRDLVGFFFSKLPPPHHAHNTYRVITNWRITFDSDGARPKSKDLGIF